MWTNSCKLLVGFKEEVQQQHRSHVGGLRFLGWMRFFRGVVCLLLRADEESPWYHVAGGPGSRRALEDGTEQKVQVGWLVIWLWLKKPVPKMGCPGKWQHGPTPAYPWLFNFEPHPFWFWGCFLWCWGTQRNTNQQMFGPPPEEKNSSNLPQKSSNQRTPHRRNMSGSLNAMGRPGPVRIFFPPGAKSSFACLSSFVFVLDSKHMGFPDRKMLRSPLGEPKGINNQFVEGIYSLFQSRLDILLQGAVCLRT